jgi:hypothetical protein
LAGNTAELTPVARRARKAILAIDGVLESPGIFGADDAFWVNGKEIGYFTDGGDVLGLRVTKRVISARRAELKQNERIVLKASSDWLHVRLENGDDVTLALTLAEVAAEAHKPAPGTPAKPPPEGVKLERMRRFH